MSKEGGLENLEKKKIKKYDTKRRTLDSWIYYSSYADDDFYILYSQLFFQTTHDCYLLFKIRLNSFSYALQIYYLGLLGQNSILF